MNINGKVLVFTDLHVGIKQASKSRLLICAHVIREICQTLKQKNINNVLFLGDWHHTRNSTENNVLNVSYKMMSALARNANITCILGNHDIYMKNSVDINSMIIFNDIKNVNIISKVTECSINGNTSLLVPWLGDVSEFQKESFDMMFGHFDASHEYIVKSYIEDHSQNNRVSENISQQLNTDSFLNSSGMTSNTAGDFIGSFVDVVKKDGTIFSGHIHGHREFPSKGRKFILVGDPYQQNLGEKEYDCGYYIINEDNTYEFHEITSTPKHIELRMSKIKDSVDSFDFSVVKGNIVHKVYDVDVDKIIDARITQKINDWQPYEELLPDYEIDFNKNNDIQLQNESIDMIKKSKLNYIKSYIQNMDKNALESQNIDPDKLFSIMAEYYEHVTEEK